MERTRNKGSMSWPDETRECWGRDRGERPVSVVQQRSIREREGCGGIMRGRRLKSWATVVVVLYVAHFPAAPSRFPTSGRLRRIAYWALRSSLLS